MIDGTPSPLRWVRDCLGLLLHTLWPVACPVCGRLGQVLCGECLSSLLTRQIPRCLSCGGPAPCIDHPRSAPILPGAIYEGKVREIIHRLKYGQTRALGPILGRGLAGLRPRPSLEVLIPVPLHLKSPRGYNQARLTESVMISALAFSTAARISSRSYLPDPRIKRDSNSLPAIASLSFILCSFYIFPFIFTYSGSQFFPVLIPRNCDTASYTLM